MLFSVSLANYLDGQNQNDSFEEMAAYGGARFNIGGKERPEAIQAAPVAPGFFSILRVHPLLGRTFSPEEDRPGQGHVAVLGHTLWRDHFGADPGIVGRDIILNGETYNVIGVMPANFKFPSWAQLWVPLAWTNEKRAVRGNHNYLVIGRLKPGVESRAAQAELSAISSRLEQLYPEDDKGWGATILPLREQLVGDVRPALLVLLGAVAFVLLIACANVANLVLGKILERKKEIAIRSALGATRGAILRQILAETVLLSLAGGALGLLLARFGVTLIVKFLADRLPPSSEITLDAPVLAFTAFLALFAGILAGLLPVLRFTRTDVNEALKQGQSRGSSAPGGSKTRLLLVVSEVALSLVLLIGAGLIVRTLWQLSSVHPGFDPNNVLTVTVPVPANQSATPVALVSESMAKRFWPNQDPLGKHLTLTFFPNEVREVVGIIGDVKLDSLDETRPVATVYWPLDQMVAPPSEPWRSFGMSLAVRTSADPLSAISAVTSAVRQVDPQTPVIDVISMNGLISNSLSPQRSNMLLLAAFAGLALVLTAVGI